MLNIIQILLSVLLVLVILMQVRGQGGGLFGAGGGSFRTRRGIELMLFRFTILLMVVFLVVSVVSVGRF